MSHRDPQLPDCWSPTNKVHIAPSDIPQSKLTMVNTEHSIAMSWALYALTQHKDVQIRLRQEASTVSTDNPTMDDLNGLPYLDAVVRETLRLYSPAPAAMRGPRKDDSIPLSKPYTDTQGVIHNELRFAFDSFLMLLYFLTSFWSLMTLGSEKVNG